MLLLEVSKIEKTTKKKEMKVPVGHVSNPTNKTKLINESMKEQK